MMLRYLAATSQIAWCSEDQSSTQTAQTATVNSFLNQPFNLFISVSMTSANNFLSAGGVHDSSNDVTLVRTPSYGSDWMFDDTIDISICSDYSGVNSIACEVQNLKIKYGAYSSTLSTIDFANTVTMLADYKLNEVSGTQLKNSQGKLGSATLSSSPPNLNSDGGLTFTSSSQYLQLPTFTPSASDMTLVVSLAFNFYLKIDTTPTSTANVMSYYCNSISGAIFGVSVTPNAHLQIQLGVYTAEVASLTLTLGQWAMVYVSYTLTYGGYSASNIYIDGKKGTPGIIKVTSYGSSAFSTSDYVRFGGGFSGHLRRIQVYSPASFRLNDSPCDSTTCSLDVGFSIPPTCLDAICTSGYYYFYGSCESCPTGCSQCTDSETCQACLTGYYLKGTTCKTLSTTVQDTLTTSQLLNSGATQVSSAISKGSVISLSAAVSGKIFSQIKYLNISYSGELQVALLTWLSSFVSLGLTPNMPQSMIDRIPDRPVPYMFEKYDVPSSFLENFWENLGVIIFTTVVWLLLEAIERFVKPKKKSWIALLPRRARVMVQNFLITALFGVYGDLALYSVLEYRTLVFGWNLSLLSFFTSVILLFAMFGSFWYQTNIVKNYQKIKKQQGNLEKFTKSHEGSQVLFRDLKDGSLVPQLFLFFLSARDLIFSLLLATMFEFPLTQTFIITILDCMMIGYLLTVKPFENPFDFAQQLFFEAIGLIVSVSVFLNAILDYGKYEATGTRNNIGKLVIISNFIFNFITAIFMLISIGQALLGFYKGYKQNRAKKIQALNIQNRIQNLQTDEHSVKNENPDKSLIVQETASLQHDSSGLALIPPVAIPVVQNRRRLKVRTRHRQPHSLNQSQDLSSHDSQETHRFSGSPSLVSQNLI